MTAILLPPAQYDHAPLVRFDTSYETAEGVKRICGGYYAACTIMGDLPPWVILPKVGPGGVSQRTQDLLRRHEQGHVNGWPASHPKS